MTTTERTTWTTKELQEDFEVQGFAAGLCVVRRKSDGQLGSLGFTTDRSVPRIYFAWMPHEDD